MTYTDIRDAAKELALNAKTMHRPDITVKAIRIHEQAAIAVRSNHAQTGEIIDGMIDQIRQLDSALSQHG